MSRSLTETLAAFQEKRAETMPIDKLKANIDQRRLLVDTANTAGFVGPGDRVAEFTLTEVDEGALSLHALLERSPLVLIFFHFAGCPACNIALPYYNDHLAPRLAELGATLVGVSPQVPDRLREIKERHALTFRIATDTGNALARRFGVTYEFDEPSRRISLESGTPIGDVTGTGTWELPMPAVVVIDREAIVRFVNVSPDWLVRTEPAAIVEAVAGIMRKPAA